MRNFLILSTILFQATFVNAQMNGQGNGQGKGHGSRPSQGMQAFSAENSAGFINYDIYDVFDALKLESDKDMQNVAGAISEYSKNTTSIKLANYKLLDEVNKLVQAKQQEAMASRNRELMLAVQAEAQEKLLPIQEQVLVADQRLNGSLEKLLTQKQFKKWVKYQASKKDNLTPKMYGNPSGNPQKRGGNRGNQGY